MAGNGSVSGNGKSSPFGSADGGKPSGGNDFIANPAGAGAGESGNDFIANPEGKGDKSGGVDLVAKGAAMKQKKGSNENTESVPSGGKLPFVKGGTEPAATRTAPKSGFAAGGGPAGPTHKPFKVSSR